MLSKTPTFTLPALLLLALASGSGANLVSEKTITRHEPEDGSSIPWIQREDDADGSLDFTADVAGTESAWNPEADPWGADYDGTAADSIRKCIANIHNQSAECKKPLEALFKLMVPIPGTNLGFLPAPLTSAEARQLADFWKIKLAAPTISDMTKIGFAMEGGKIPGLSSHSNLRSSLNGFETYNVGGYNGVQYGGIALMMVGSNTIVPVIDQGIRRSSFFELRSADKD